MRFVNINVASFDAYKHGSELPVIADAREALTALTEALDRYRVPAGYAERVSAGEEPREEALVDRRRPRAYRSRRCRVSRRSSGPSNPRASAPADVVVQAAGSLPGDLHKLWRVRDPLGYHVEYAFSCMGYEIMPVALGAKRGLDALGDDRDVIVMVGDGSYLMLHSELATAVAEGVKLIIVLIQNEGFASIGHLSEAVGSQRFGTSYRYLDPQKRSFDTGAYLPVDLAANARSYGIDVTVEIAPGPIGDRRPERRGRRRPRRAAPPRSFTSPAIPSSTRPTAKAGGTCPWPRSPSWRARSRHARRIPRAAGNDSGRCSAEHAGQRARKPSALTLRNEDDDDSRDHSR